jgi:hypothetical protein
MGLNLILEHVVFDVIIRERQAQFQNHDSLGRALEAAGLDRSKPL